MIMLGITIFGSFNVSFSQENSSVLVGISIPEGANIGYRYQFNQYQIGIDLV